LPARNPCSRATADRQRVQVAEQLEHDRLPVRPSSVVNLRVRAVTSGNESSFAAVLAASSFSAAVWALAWPGPTAIRVISVAATRRRVKRMFFSRGTRGSVKLNFGAACHNHLTRTGIRRRVSFWPAIGHPAGGFWMSRATLHAP
jgi:hypothetical protein